MKFYITRNGFNYTFALAHPQWSLDWGRYRWRSYNATGMCVKAGHKLLKTLGVKPLTASEKDKRVLIQVKLNSRTKTWEATEWVMR